MFSANGGFNASTSNAKDKAVGLMSAINVRQACVRPSGGMELSIPYWDIESGNDGPVLLAIACQHGNELNGCEAVRLFADRAGRDLQQGRILCVPFANPQAIRHRRPHLDLGPEQPYIESRGHNMQTLWPGRPDGNETERAAAALWETVVRPATHVVDIHGYPRSAAPLVQYRDHFAENRNLARLMAFPFTRRVPTGDVGDWLGALGNQAGLAGKRAIGVELRGQYEVSEQEARRGLRGLVNVARHLGMMPGEPEGLDKPVFALSDPPLPITVQARQSGLFVVAELQPGDYVGEGQMIGLLLCDRSLGQIPIEAPVSGYLTRFGAFRPNCDVSLRDQHAFVFDGDAVAVILPRPFEGPLI